VRKNIGKTSVGIAVVIILSALPTVAAPNYSTAATIEGQGEGKWIFKASLDKEGCELAMKAPEVMLADFAAANRDLTIAKYIMAMGPVHATKVSRADGQACASGLQEVQLDLITGKHAGQQ
jgi:hypothetical protein